MMKTAEVEKLVAMFERDKMAERLQEGSRYKYTSWFARRMWHSGFGTEAAAVAAKLVDDATSDSYKYSEALYTIFHFIVKKEDEVYRKANGEDDGSF